MIYGLKMNWQVQWNKKKRKISDQDEFEEFRNRNIKIICGMRSFEWMAFAQEVDSEMDDFEKMIIASMRQENKINVQILKFDSMR